MSRLPPDMVHVAFSMPDQTVAVMGFVTAEYTPSGEVRWSRLATVENVEAEIIKSFPSDFSAENLPVWRFVTGEDVPSERAYRNAWRIDGEKIIHDMPTARELHRDLLRAERSPLLADLDIQFMRALESGTETVSISSEKQTLRDATKDPRIDSAQTIEELKAVTLDG